FEVVQDGDNLVGRQLGSCQGSALALGVGAFASAAVNHADLLVAAAPAAEINVAVTAFAVVGAGGIGAGEVVHAQAGRFDHDASPCPVYSPGYDSLDPILFGLFALQGYHPSGAQEYNALEVVSEAPGNRSSRKERFPHPRRGFVHEARQDP